ncbi:type II toxin-antitoxin system HipA family toxin [Janthinobacterium lividum]|uniref:Type II toxin-antitoxin system HipA family toxin n=1 Tax=Janthinobacterium lividum TaxID=29581 RepID=A0A5C4NU03_9BURK|nr:type II toxin-antitoxin system HipA family toxin [Janthinobacterium lividum]TNC76177.1 type II toxin-antitoxin system HipA family toxin [Janthinobacterium lividum]
MGRKAHAQRLNVWLNGTPVGCWDAMPGKSAFTYFDTWLDDEAGRPLSLSMPFKPHNEAYRGAVVQHYFDNLLPDSEPIRRRLALHFHTDGIEPYQLLAAVGRDCVGAIQLLPPGETPVDLFSITGEPLDAAGVAGILRNTLAEKTFGHGAGADELRLSIAGAQEKSALLWHQGQWHRPTGNTPTTHIFKLPMGLVGNMQADMRTSVENEWLCSQIMQAFGLPTASCTIQTFDGLKTLVVERFDRRLSHDGSWIIRLPQEDFCQATGTSPLRKYQADGGPGITRIMEILLGSAQAESDRQRFFKTQLIFWLLAATDGHAKNFSIVHLPHRQFQATPLYDILSAHPIIGHGAHQLAYQRARLAMALRGTNNHYGISEIQRRHWSSHARQVGLGAAAAEHVIEEVLASVDNVITQVSALLAQEFPADVAASIFEGLRRSSKRLREMPA